MDIKKINQAINIIYKFSAAKNYDFDGKFFNFSADKYYEKSRGLLKELRLPNTNQLVMSLYNYPDIAEQELWHARYSYLNKV